MRRLLGSALCALLTTALLTFGSSPAATAAAPLALTPSTPTVTLTFDLTEAVDDAMLMVSGPHAAIVLEVGALEPGPAELTWDGRAEGGGLVADGDYQARIISGGVPVTEPRSIRVNLRKPGHATPKVSRTTLFPSKDGYQDRITITKGAPRAGARAVSSVVEIINRSGTTVWTTRSGRSQWAGRTSKGKIVAPGTYRVRVRTTDIDGLVGVTAARKVKVSNKRLVTIKERATISPRKFMVGWYVGKCGELSWPARKGKAWRGSVAVKSKHRCKGGKHNGLTEGHFAAREAGAYDIRALRIETIGRGHTRAKRHQAYGAAVTWKGRVSKLRRLPARASRRVIFKSSGRALRRYLDKDNNYQWVVATVGGGRYDIKAFRVTTTYRKLVGPRKAKAIRSARTATVATPTPTTAPYARGPVLR